MANDCIVGKKKTLHGIDFLMVKHGASFKHYTLLDTKPFKQMTMNKQLIPSNIKEINNMKAFYVDVNRGSEESRVAFSRDVAYEYAKTTIATYCDNHGCPQDKYVKMVEELNKYTWIDSSDYGIDVQIYETETID